MKIPETKPTSGSNMWENEYQRVSKQIEDCKTDLANKAKTKVNLEILRVNQLDAITLDNEIDEIIGSQFMRIFTFFRVS